MRFVFSLLLLVPALAFADPWHGVFRGQLGAMPVYVCLDGTDGDAFGQYYYEKYRKLIALLPQPGLRWHETNAATPSGVWQLTQNAGNMTGTWSHAGKTLPIRLEPVPFQSDDAGPCGSDAFHNPREVPPKRVVRQATVQGNVYDELQWQNQTGDALQVTGLRLRGESPGIRSVNELLARDAPDTPARVRDYYDCVRGNRLGGERTVASKPVLLTASWLVTLDTDGGYCGGAHPFEGISRSTYDLRAGKAVDVWRWFYGVGVETPSTPGDAQAVNLFGKLRGELDARWRHDKRREADCADVMGGENPINVAPSATGLVFTPQLAHVIFACTDTVEIPFAKVTRFLNAAGKAAVAQIQTEALKPMK